MGLYENGHIYGDPPEDDPEPVAPAELFHKRVPRDVAQRSTVDVTGAVSALSVGPDDVLVVVFPDYVSASEMELLRNHFYDTGLRDRFILIAGAESMAKVRRDHGRSYPRPGTRDVESDVVYESRMGD
jgi:hypothetical protein